jgi:N-acylneuraminate cytidylyltransferase
MSAAQVPAPRILGVICARGGSKGLPRKNVLPLGRMPTIAWSVLAANASKRLTRSILSTDDEEIADAARQAGGDVPFLRPVELAGDEIGIDAALIHALSALGGNWDAIVLLQATSPFRKAEDIDACIDKLLASDAPGVVSVTKSPKPPHWMYALDDGQRLVPLLPELSQAHRRQDLPSAFVPNGAVYAMRLPHFANNRKFYEPGTLGHVMPPERSVDIDTPLDFAYAQALLASGLVS